MEEKYKFGPDLCRAAALVLVVITHGVGLSQAYAYSGMTGAWLGTMAVHVLSHSCVPLFLLLSGYLGGGRSLSLRHYRGVFRLAVPYLLISLLCALELRLFDLGQLSPGGVLAGILDFSLNGYAWYVEMYLGLFLVQPFLNLLWDRIPSRGWKRAFLGILALLTLMPDTMESLLIRWGDLRILPDYFNVCFPLTYFFLGRYLREHGETMRRRQGPVLLAAGYLVPLGLVILRSYVSGSYAGGYTLNTFGSIFVALCAMGLFLLLTGIPDGGPLKRPVRLLSKVSYEMYLCSYLFDQILYDQLRLPFLLTSLLVLLGSFVLALLVRLVSEPLIRLCCRLWDRAIQA